MDTILIRIEKKYYSTVTAVYDANNSIELKDYYTLRYNNVAYGYANSQSNTFIITQLTGNFDKINNGDYTSNIRLKDIVFSTDNLIIGNTSNVVVTSVNYDNSILYCNLITTNTGNSTNPVLLSVVRNFNSNEIFIER